MAEVIERARELGADAGKAAASWYFDGNTPQETYAHVLRGLEDGDPEIIDSLPAAPLSGEWADGPTPSSVLEELAPAVVPEGYCSSCGRGVLEAPAVFCDGCGDELLTAYEDGFCTAAAHEVERAARYQVEG